MITIKEIIGKTNIDSIPLDHRRNIEELFIKINKIRSSYNKTMIVTSGYRSKEDHLRIYKEKGIIDINKIPMKSKHLFGQAIDIYDPKKELQSWCVQNESLLKEIGLWLEDFEFTKNWVHFQIVPYASYKNGKSIWFKP